MLPSMSGRPVKTLLSWSRLLAAGRTTGVHRGRCPICERSAVSVKADHRLRDHYYCLRCGSLPRFRALIRSGVPVVGTSLAVEGIGLDADEGALVADDPREFARQVLRVYRSEELWNHLSRSGFRRAQRDYSTAAGRANVARAAVELGVATRRARARLSARTRSRDISA